MSSTADRTEIETRIGTLVMRWQDATQAFDDAVGERLQLNPAERRCLAFVIDGPQPAGAIAQATGLTPAAVTALVDRLEKRGLLERTRSGEDRRRVMVAATEAGRRDALHYYAPIAAEGAGLLAAMDVRQLEAVAQFLERILALQERHLAALSARPERREG